MDALTAINTRRSIRKYTNQPVPDELVEIVIRAAMFAPSTGNQQPWQFVVIRERATLDAIQEFHPHSAMLKQASVAILVCGDTKLERHPGFWVQDCSAATQNMLLAAHAAGLGAVWLGIYPLGDRIQGFKNLLGIPEHVFPLSLVPLGYPAEKVPDPERFDRSRIRMEKW